MTWVLNPNRSKVEFHSLYRDKVSYALLYRSPYWTIIEPYSVVIWQVK